MCRICRISKNSNNGKVYFEGEKWIVIHDTNLDLPCVIWKKHSKVVNCDTCLMWIELKCMELFGRHCKYEYNLENFKHFHFYVKNTIS